MAEFKATIFDGDNVFLEDVEVDLEVHVEPSELSSWDVLLTLPGVKIVEPGKQFRLVLEDGRSGTMFIKRSQTGSSGETIIEFQGTGPLER